MKAFLSQISSLLLVVGIVVWGLAPNAEARLGETKEQLVERYGEPLREAEPELPSSESAFVFFKDLVEVHVEFKKGKAWMVTYRVNRLTSELKEQFQAANDGEDGTGEWKEPVEHLGRTYLSTADERRFGVYYILGNGQMFRFCTSECRDALATERRARIEDAIINGVRKSGGKPAAGEVEEKEAEEEDSPF